MPVTPENLAEYMELALDLGRAAAEHDEIPIGAVLVDSKGNLLGTGYNLREETNRTTAHAEIVALEDYNTRFKSWRLPPDTSLFVTAEPCVMCAGALLWARLDDLYYGCRDPKQGGWERIRALVDHGVFDHRFRHVEGGVSEESAASLLTDYFRAKRAEKKKA